jgi:hypothetical protein
MCLLNINLKDSVKILTLVRQVVLLQNISFALFTVGQWKFALTNWKSIGSNRANVPELLNCACISEISTKDLCLQDNNTATIFNRKILCFLGSTVFKFMDCHAQWTLSIMCENYPEDGCNTLFWNAGKQVHGQWSPKTHEKNPWNLRAIKLRNRGTRTYRFQTYRIKLNPAIYCSISANVCKASP